MFIPDNRFSEKIKKLMSMCLQLEEIDESDFSDPITYEELEMWENTHQINIPDSYKEWLLFSKSSCIFGALAEFYMPVQDKNIPEEYITIGTLVGDGERLCFEKSSGDIIRYNHGEISRVSDFEQIIDWVIYMLSIQL